MPSPVAARSLKAWVRIPPGHGRREWVLSGHGVGLITRQEVSECGASECDNESLTMRRPWTIWAVAPW